MQSKGEWEMVSREGGGAPWKSHWSAYGQVQHISGNVSQPVWPEGGS